ncbi:MAG: FkbM family methyltransferase [Candidatus Eisenbacteria bacterium]|uniref:FkbM family methyltransferase n=1 Tax=Eiseniibacteriota bacterium TaxID=2212470 RepID=A0A849SLA3_UNCEI|nr:FkbM family methyltransferase [Candidatus Eisenbacteria bacterium]
MRRMISLPRRAVHAYRDVRIRLLGKAPSWRRVSRDLEMQIDPSDWMDRAFYLGTYDPALLWLVRRVVRPGHHALDVGAQKGFVSLHLARAVGAAGRVLAFEPDPRMHAQLERHRDRNRLGWLDIEPLALGRESATSSFALSRVAGWSSLFPNPEALSAMSERVEIPVRSLDELVRTAAVRLDPRRLSFVKIDVEGAEPLALQGMRETLATADATLWVEVNRASLAAAGSTPGSISEALESAGYRALLPRFSRRLGLPHVTLEPLRSLDDVPHEVFDVVGQRASSPPLVRSGR